MSGDLEARIALLESLLERSQKYLIKAKIDGAFNYTVVPVDNLLKNITTILGERESENDERNM